MNLGKPKRLIIWNGGSNYYPAANKLVVPIYFKCITAYLLTIASMVFFYAKRA